MAKRSKFSGPDDPRVRRALCIVAHPDDIDFFCAGTVLRLTRRGATVDFVLVTSGDKGSRDREQTGAKLAATREREQLAAAEVLGAEGVAFLRHGDAEVVESLELRGELVREIRRSRPDVLLTFDPTPAYRQHPDHRAVGRVALDAAWPCARDRLTYPELGPPHETAEAWLFAGPGADLVVDVRPELEDKIRARLQHRSQTGSPAVLRARWRRIAAEERFAQVDLR
ncbi:MAG: PIG-L family deacetylase [Candidatus Dormibacteraeota bacterium]|nr:PIG-L family deacetylase [Candidatus Dormibacteraeota bacterium]